MDEMAALTIVASRAVVAAAATDAWEAVRHRFARLMGRGDSQQTHLIEQRLEITREQLTTATGAESEKGRATLEAPWAALLADLLQKDPSAEADVRALVEAIQAALPAGKVSAADHAVATGRDVTITASGGGVAAGVIHGNVTMPNPTWQGPLAPSTTAPVPGREFSGRKAKLFISYSHRDERYREQLGTHLAGLRRQGLIADWHDRKIVPGKEWRDAIDQNLDTSDCVLLLVSPDFLASDYCYGIEMQRTLEKHREGRVIAIPVIVRPADWRQTPLGELQALPKDAKPVVEWTRRDRAWLDVIEGIRRALAPS